MNKQQEAALAAMQEWLAWLTTVGTVYGCRRRFRFRLLYSGIRGLDRICRRFRNWRAA